MINQISIKNFKSLKSTNIPLSAVNINYGLNGMGKSSFIQSLLLIKQSIDEQLLPDNGVTLNGSYVSLGVGKDVFCESGDDTEGIEFKFELKGKKCILNLDYSPSLQEFDVLPINKEKSSEIKYLLDNVDINYLASDRISPQSFFGKSNYHVIRKNTLGHRGQFLAHFLDHYETLEVPNERRHVEAFSERLDENIGKWLQEISPDIKYQANSDLDNNIANIRFFYSNKRSKTRTHKPANVGYGLTNVLPLITILLSCKPNSILILENPELHLHPKGQESLGELICKCAKSNVQLFIETHSTELVNSITKYSKEYDTSYSLNFFHREPNSFETKVSSHKELSTNIPDILSFLSSESLMKQKLQETLSEYDKTIVLTEGKTDVKILNHILSYFKENGEFTNLDITITSLETIDGGDKLLQVSKNLGELSKTKIICLFDRDFKGRVKIDETSSILWKKHSSNVFLMILPCPSFRENGDNVSIELLFSNETLLLKDENGRRLFISSEFDNHGDHKTEPGVRLLESPKFIEKVCLCPHERILDSEKDIIDSSKRKLVQSKADFAQRIEEKLIPVNNTDLESFRVLFKSIEDIVSAV